MIQAQYIKELCDRFEPYLVPLDIHILRQRYNGKIRKSTYTIGREMKISDETVRKIENRALVAIAQCLDLEANGQDITPMRLAKSFRQPMASDICDGSHCIATCPGYTSQRGELLIHTSGMIIGRVMIVDCYEGPAMASYPHKWRLRFEQPEIFEEPITHKGQLGFFYIDNDVAQQLPPRYAYTFASPIRSGLSRLIRALA